MKCLKVDEYITRTASIEETLLLYQELKRCVQSNFGLQGRTLCDRIIRACNHQLGVGSQPLEHIHELVKLVELSLHGYEVSSELLGQSSPLYMEKIIFHIVKKLSSLKVPALCCHVADLLYNRLSSAQQAQDEYFVLVRSCFAVLWNGIYADKDGKIPSAQNKFHSQIQASRFLLLLDSETPDSTFSKAPLYMQEAITQFEDSCGAITKEDASFLLQEIHTLVNRSFKGTESERHIETSRLYVLSEIVLLTVKAICKSGHSHLSTTFLKEMERIFYNCTGSQCLPLVIGMWGVEILSAAKSDIDYGQVLKKCARALRCLSADMSSREVHAVLEGCNLVMWAVENGHSKALCSPELLALFSFLEEHQEQIMKIVNKSSTCPAESNRLRQSLCCCIYQGFVFAYESMLAAKLEDTDALDRVLLYCQATAVLLMTELHNLSNENIFNKAVIAMSNLACGLYNRRLYDQSFTLIEIVCRDLCKNCPSSLSVDRLSRPFMLAVQTSRRTGKLEQALDWVIRWLKILGDQITAHMGEPVSLWVKIKSEAACDADEDIRLRTLRDGFGPDVPEENIMLSLLDEELRAYKELARDTAQERYNTLCDLLDICHEESSHTLLRAVYLCEMAQVVCFQDFSEQTDCMAVDFTHEALRLLEEEPETSENADRLKDDKAHALLWLYICTLEKNLQEAIENDRKLQEVQRKTQCVAKSVGNNDFDYEDKQKMQDSTYVYEGLQLNLVAEKKFCQPLEQALEVWTSLLKNHTLPTVRNPKQTCSSISVVGSIFRLMGKPLKALDAFQLEIRFSRKLGDSCGCANALCQSASILLEMGTPQLALTQIEEAEKIVTSEATDEGPSSLFMQVILLKAQYFYTIGKVSAGIPYLCKVLKEVNGQKQSKKWYLLRALTLQTCGVYLNLDSEQLLPAQRNLITQHGFSTPDAALYDSLKLLCSLLVTLVGKGLYGTSGSDTNVHFIHKGDNLFLKWQLLTELLSCSRKMVAVRSNSGAISDARLQCLEALKLATKLQALSQCAELLVIKAELELMLGEQEESKTDLNFVKNLLECCTDLSDHIQKKDVKIKPRKGRPARRPCSPFSNMDDDDFKDILSTRWIAKEPVTKDVSSSPPLKALPQRWLSSLTHEADCRCPCCSEPHLSRATAHWAATQADLVLQTNLNDLDVSFKLHRLTLIHCKNATIRLKYKLAAMFPPHDTVIFQPSLMQDVIGHVYLSMAEAEMQKGLHKVSAIWKILDAGLVFVNSSSSPVLRPVRARLLAIKAMASLMILASKKGCRPEELYSNVWSWKPFKNGKTEQTNVPSLSKQKKLKDSQKNSEISNPKKDSKNIKPAKPKIQVTRPTKDKGSVPKTPAMKSKSSGVFEFNTAVPTLAFTPVPRGRCMGSEQRAPKTTSKLRVYEEISPVQDKLQPVPAAPRRTKKSYFKVEFSDDSDSEAPSREEVNVKDAPKKRTSRRACPSVDAPAKPPAEKAPGKRQTRGKKSTAVPLCAAFSEDETFPQPASTRRGRTRRQVSKSVGSWEEPDTMRTIEEITEVLNMSIEQLRTSDTEAEKNAFSAPDTYMEFEVLRRDVCCDVEKNGQLDIKCTDHPRVDLPPHIVHSDNRPEDLSLDDIQSLLRSALLSFQHFPCPTIYPSICSLLALTMGQSDALSTAVLHAQSLGVTSRHRTLRHLSSSLQKLKKASSEITCKMNALSLNESSETVSTASTQLRLSRLEEIFSFSTAEPSSFPQDQCRDFLQKMNHLPPGVTVCLMSVLGVTAGQMGESIMLSRLEKDSSPVTLHISTAKEQHSIRWLVQEIDSILVEQKAVSCVAEKEKWWQGRRALDCRVEQLLKDMERVLGCWKSLLLPLSSDPELSTLAQNLRKALAERGVMVDEAMLKVVLSASHILSKEELKSFALGFSSNWDAECDRHLQTAVSQLSERDESPNHVVLVLDKYLQKLPWESMSVLKSRSVSRMPSLHSLLGLNLQKDMESQPVLKLGVNTRQVFYVLDPDANLRHAQDLFKESFCSKPEWEGVCGVPPDVAQLEEAVTTKDLYIYVGHGAGARFLDSQSVLRRQMRAASLLLGCSSAALAVRGNQEGQGIILNYLIAGCPFILGNLWDVTDRDIDRFTKVLLESWFSAGSGAPLLEHMGSARQATHLKYLVGAAPVVYGLPVHLL